MLSIFLHELLNMATYARFWSYRSRLGLGFWFIGVCRSVVVSRLVLLGFSPLRVGVLLSLLVHRSGFLDN